MKPKAIKPSAISKINTYRYVMSYGSRKIVKTMKRAMAATPTIVMSSCLLLCSTELVTLCMLNGLDERNRP